MNDVFRYVSFNEVLERFLSNEDVAEFRGNVPMWCFVLCLMILIPYFWANINIKSFLSRIEYGLYQSHPKLWLTFYTVFIKKGPFKSLGQARNFGKAKGARTLLLKN